MAHRPSCTPADKLLFPRGGAPADVAERPSAGTARRRGEPVRERAGGGALRGPPRRSICRSDGIGDATSGSVRPQSRWIRPRRAFPLWRAAGDLRLQLPIPPPPLFFPSSSAISSIPDCTGGPDGEEESRRRNNPPSSLSH